MMGRSRLQSAATTGPATQNCTPPGGESARLPAHVQWHNEAGSASPHPVWTPGRELGVRSTSLRGSLVAGAIAPP